MFAARDLDRMAREHPINSSRALNLPRDRTRAEVRRYSKDVESCPGELQQATVELKRKQSTNCDANTGSSTVKRPNSDNILPCRVWVKLLEI